ALLAIPGANRKIALAGGLDPADRRPAVPRKFLRAAPRVLIGFGDHLGLQRVELREGVAYAATRQFHTVAQQLGLFRISRPGLDHVIGPKLDRAPHGKPFRPLLLVSRTLAADADIAVGNFLGPETCALEEDTHVSGLTVDGLLDRRKIAALLREI